MKIIKPSVEIISNIDWNEAIHHIERCGRVCYKSEDKIAEGTAEQFIRNLIKRGHTSVLEHISFTVKFIVDRGISHEIVRHRLASFSQESTRYCNYSMEHKFGSEITVIEPCFLEPGTKGYQRWAEACSDCEDAYFELLGWGCTAQEARNVLPHSLKAEIVMTADITEWRHFLRVRCNPAAHPQMREVATQLLKICRESAPCLFDDILEG
ncbi:MAG: FAD-dependent thymidylate synthase [Eubacterium sp.]|nr:FAD-dependent thymidylate synthase [Eubacterium sp.]